MIDKQSSQVFKKLFYSKKKEKIRALSIQGKNIAIETKIETSSPSFINLDLDRAQELEDCLKFVFEMDIEGYKPPKVPLSLK